MNEPKIYKPQPIGQTYLTIGGDIRIADIGDDDAPLMEMRFHNEWRRRFDALRDDDKIMLGEAIRAVINQTFIVKE